MDVWREHVTGNQVTVVVGLFWKALLPMDVTVLGIVIVSSLQFLNASAPIVNKPSGKLMDLRLVQLLNASLLIFFSVEGNSMDSSEVQLARKLAGIVCCDVGKLIDLRFVQ